MAHRTMFYGGPIITCNLRDEVEEAMVIEDERILYVGTKADARCLTDADTAVINTEGRAVLPGFYAASLDFWQGNAGAGTPFDPPDPDGTRRSERTRRALAFARQREQRLYADGITGFCECGESGAEGLRSLLRARLDLSATVLLCGEGEADMPARLTGCGLTDGFGDGRVRIGAVRVPVTADNAGSAARREKWCLRVRDCLAAGLCVRYEPEDENTLLTAVRAHTSLRRLYPAVGRGCLRIPCALSLRACEEIAAARLSVLVDRRLLTDGDGGGEFGVVRYLRRFDLPLTFVEREGESARSPLCIVADAARAFSGPRPHSDAEIKEALRCATLGGAAAAGTDSECGSLEWGKRADVLLLSGDPLRASLSDLRRMSVRALWRAGKRVYTAAAAGAAPAVPAAVTAVAAVGTVGVV